VRKLSGQLRLSVSIRGVNPIDTTTLDDNDLRLVNELGVRTKLRLVNFIQFAGVVIANYRVSRGLLAPGTFSVRAIHGQVLDDQGNGNASRVIGSVVV
jgi:hypothetical protein